MMLILYVDDEPDLLELGKLFLEREGKYAVDTITSAQEALSCMASKDYDAIIADYQMPVMDGIDLLRTVRKSRSSIPFILFTGKGREEVVIQALNEGADFYLQKGGDPVSQFAELSHKVRLAIEHRQAEHALAESRNDMETIFSAVKAGIVVVDVATHRIQDLNPAAQQMIGLPREEILGTVCHEHICPAEAGKCPISDLGLKVDNSEKYLLDSAGHRIPIIKYVSQVDLYGKPCLLETFIDNTARKRAEEELRAAYEQLAARDKALQEQLRSLETSHAEWVSTFDAIPDWIALISPDGRILRSNNAVELLFGLSPEDAVGKTCHEIVHGADCRIEGCPCRPGPLSRERKVAEIPTRDGTGWLQITIDPVFDDNGEPVSAVHIVKDITERIRSQKALERAKKKLNLLNYVTFNDIQNMIFTITGYQHLAEQALPDHPARKILAKQNALLQKIAHSLKFAQSYQDLGLKPPRWQNVNQVFLLAISHLDFLHISHATAVNGIEIFADPLLEQVFQILADNTLIHAKTATRVRVSSLTGPETLTLVYEDDGIGIDPDHKEKIFSPDFQKKKAVGLFLAREILEITGMTIRETGEPGRGARFEITVPAGAWRGMDPR